MAKDKTVGVLDFDDAIRSVLAEYKAEVLTAVNKAVKEIAVDAAGELKRTSPKRTGAYAKSWSYKVTKGTLGTSSTVYNKDHYRLTHLLEKPHALRGGGRYDPVASGTVHIAPAADHAAENFMRELERELGKI